MNILNLRMHVRAYLYIILLLKIYFIYYRFLSLEIIIF